MTDAERTAANRLSWDEWARIHLRGSLTYPIEDFKAGRIGATPNIPDDIGCVTGKSILHLQCHFGMDSIHWSRLGARVTGLDFSPVAIAQARQLAKECNSSAMFVEGDVMKICDVITEQFDIVLTYYGVLCWLFDLRAWANGIAASLKPNGFLYLCDSHPISNSLEFPIEEDHPQIQSPYFKDGRPVKYVATEGTYANPTVPLEQGVNFEWQHTLAEIIDSLLSAGLVLTYLHEFPFSFYDNFYFQGRNAMESDADGKFWLKNRPQHYPMLFSVWATKP